MPVDNLIPLLYSPTPNTKPLISTRLTGELWTNLADLQLGLIDATQASVPLIAVRYFSPNTAYVGGDFVIQAGHLYIAKSAVPIGPFNAAQWTAMQTAADVAAAYLPLAGGTLTGPLTLSGNATQALHAVPLQQVATLAMGDNRIINGDMRIDQRNNGASGTAGGYTIDRWQFSATQSNKLGWQRVGSSAVGFPYGLGVTSSSAYAVLTGDNFVLAQPVEADMISDFAWGTANAQPVTLSFWVASSLTGTFGGSIRTYTTPYRSYPFSFSIPTANTPTRIVINIPGDTSGTWTLLGNSGGLSLFFDLGAGATFRGTAGAWAAGDLRGATGAVSLVGTNGATWVVTGVKLEIGSVATPFNRQSLAKSQADCERYFRWLSFNMAFAASAAGVQLSQTVMFSQMRAAPTMSGIAADPNAAPAVLNNSSNAYANITSYGAQAYLISTAAGNCYVQGYRASASAEL